MKVLASYSSDVIVKVNENEEFDECISHYVVQVDDISDKVVPKGFWRELVDDEGNPIWEETNDSGLLKPSKGFVVSDHVKVKFKRHPQMWTIEEIIAEKYKKKLMSCKFDGLYYQEFIKMDDILFEGSLNLGKKFCAGQGTLIHKLNPNFKEFILETECFDKLPEMYVSPDNQSWSKIDSCFYSHRFKKETNQIYLKIDDYNNHLTAYAIYY
jgi:hypothetical protein